MSNEHQPREADLALIRDAFANRGDAVTCLVARLMPVIRAVVGRKLRSEGCGGAGRVEGDDLVQDMWLALVANDGRRLRGYRPERGISLESYVAILTERELIDLHRRAQARKRGGHLEIVEIGLARSIPSPDQSPEQLLADAELISNLHVSLDSELPERGRLIWRYAFTDGRDPHEIAELIGVSVQVVYNWQHKIRRLARAFFERHRREDSAMSCPPTR